MGRVLVLGATSYVAQFLLQRLLRDAGGGEGEAERVELACAMRCSAFSPLPTGFVTAASVLEKPLSDAKRAGLVQVYWGVDMLDTKALQRCVEDFRPTDVINCAALSSPAVCQKSPERARAVNEPYNVAELLEQLAWPVRLIHFSTDFVYDGVKPYGESYDEDDAVESTVLSEYGVGKLRFDQFLQEKDRSGDLRSVILRIANVVGPPATLFRHLKTPPKFMEWLHSQLFQTGTPGGVKVPPLNLWSDEFRSFVYIHDLVTVVRELLALGCEVGCGLFNVGGQDALSRVELAQQYLGVCQALNPAAVSTVVRQIEPTARAKVDLGYPSPLNTRLSTKKLSALLPEFSWTPTREYLAEISRALI